MKVKTPFQGKAVYGLLLVMLASMIRLSPLSIIRWLLKPSDYSSSSTGGYGGGGYGSHK